MRSLAIVKRSIIFLGDHASSRPSVHKGVATIEATEAAASVINSASYILKYTTILTEPRACHDKFVC